MTTRNRIPRAGDAKSAAKAKRNRRSGNSGPIAFFVSLFIIAVGTIQLVSTFNTYAADLAHLNSLKREEAALVAQKQELENDISRWDDKNYVAAQARERLGFVFPGETPVRVQNPQAVTGDGSGTGKKTGDDTDTSKQLPWYSELSYAFKKADEPLPKNSTGTQGTTGTQKNQQDSGSTSTDTTTTKKDQQ
ncbi:FtsB family cell division protein [Bifidobacterium parmae]|nr:septum formation initiator family protein [Bifidobacterium parmae]